MRVEGSSGSPSVGPGRGSGSDEAQWWTQNYLGPLAQGLQKLPPDEAAKLKDKMKEAGALADQILHDGEPHSPSVNFLLILMLGMAKLAELDDRSMANVGRATQLGVQQVGAFLARVGQEANKVYLERVKDWNQQGNDDKGNRSSEISAIMGQMNAAQADLQSQTSNVQSAGSTLASTAQGLTQQQSADAQNLNSLSQLIQQILSGLSRTLGN